MEKKRGPKYHQIIDAAVKVIAMNGYHQAQVSKIAREAGVADGTIYLYFRNKEDILISLFQEKMGQAIEKTKAKLEGVSLFEDKLFWLIHMHFTWLDSDRYLAIVTQLELRQSNAKLRIRINAILREYLDLIDSVLEVGKESGYFSKDLDSRLARQMIFGTLDEVTTSWVMKECKYDLVSLAKPVQDLLVKGLCSHK